MGGEQALEYGEYDEESGFENEEDFELVHLVPQKRR